MGAAVSYWSKPKRILVMGEGGGGKTTLLYKLKLGFDKDILTVSTIGFNEEQVEFNGQKLDIYCAGGHINLYNVWKHNFKNAEGLIFVVDSGYDEAWLQDSFHYFDKLMQEEELKKCPVLVFVNKSDRPDPPASTETVIESHKLGDLKRPWKCIPSTFLNGTGVNEGLNWLIEEMNK